MSAALPIWHISAASPQASSWRFSFAVRARQAAPPDPRHTTSAVARLSGLAAERIPDAVLGFGLFCRRWGRRRIVDPIAHVDLRRFLGFGRGLGLRRGLLCRRW